MVRCSCAHDQRIWKDFDAMVLNDQWIAEHLSSEQPRLVAAMMPGPEDLLRAVRAGRGDQP